jgi:hypothetical protein
MTSSSTPGAVHATDPMREAMRAALLAQGFDAAAVETMLPAQAAAYRVRQAVTDAIAAMSRDLPGSVKTWAPYLRLLAEGLPDLCPCPCPACSAGSCPCPGGAEGHDGTCAMPADELHADCAGIAGRRTSRRLRRAVCRRPRPAGR